MQLLVLLLAISCSNDYVVYRRCASLLPGTAGRIHDVHSYLSLDDHIVRQLEAADPDKVECPARVRKAQVRLTQRGICSETSGHDSCAQQQARGVTAVPCASAASVTTAYCDRGPAFAVSMLACLLRTASTRAR